jgi:hypothetical protein
MKQLGWTLIQYDRCPYKKWRFGDTYPQKQEHREKVVLDRLRREALESTLTTPASDFWPPEL